jgi:hypothetical protein
MPNVYVVMYEYWDAHELIGVYSTLEKAEEAIERNQDRWDGHLSIYTQEIDDPNT